MSTRTQWSPRVHLLAATLACASVSTVARASEPPVEDDDGDGFEIVDLTEDEEALAKEIQVETKAVTGESGTITGRVIDAATGDPLVGAYVEAMDTEYFTKTDFDGRYQLELPVGTFELRIRYDANEPRRISNVVIEPGASQTLDSELKPLAGANQVVVVEAEMNKESAGARLLQRKESTATRDIMSGEEMRKAGGGSTATVATRVVGVSLVGGRYVFVRGLGHRYVNTLFDGVRVPSPEPEIRTVPLDIFPSSALSAINIQKVFTPDVPGDFAGGSIQLESRGIPDKFTFQLGAFVGGNTATTFRSMLTHGSHGAYDAFALGNVPRALPDVIPDHADADSTIPGTVPAPTRFPYPERRRFGLSLDRDTRIRHGGTAPVDFGFRAMVGHGFSPHKGGRLGFVAAATYQNTHMTRRWDRWRIFNLQGGEVNPVPLTDFTGISTTNNVSWSAIGLVKYEPNKSHQISALAFYSREADDETREFEGTASGVATGDIVRSTRTRYLMRSIMMTRFGGRHTLPGASGAEIDWFGAYSQATRDDPNLRFMVYTATSPSGGMGPEGTPPPPLVFNSQDGEGSGQFFFMNLADDVQNGALNLTLPFKQWLSLPGRVKIGAWIEGRQRRYSVRNFDFQERGNAIEGSSGVGNIYTDDRIGGGDGTNEFSLAENTPVSASYKATQEIYAAYGLVDLPFTRWFKASAGARFEASDIDLDLYDILNKATTNDLRLKQPRLENRDWLPSVALIFSPTERQNVRIVGTRTVGRPEFRELSRFRFLDLVGGASVIGNPDLVSTHIWNVDLRWEWFPSVSEVIAISAFYKHFEDPIERVRYSGGGSVPEVSYRNAEKANNVGGELELRKNLAFIWKPLVPLSIGLNATYTYSRVDLAPRCVASPEVTCDTSSRLDFSTSRHRPLQDQSPWTVNADLTYDSDDVGLTTSVLYHVEGRRIQDVGGVGLPDVYLEPRHELHFVLQQRLYHGLKVQLRARNLANAPWYTTQGGRVQERYRVGTSLQLGLQYDF